MVSKNKILPIHNCLYLGVSPRVDRFIQANPNFRRQIQQARKCPGHFGAFLGTVCEQFRCRPFTVHVPKFNHDALICFRTFHRCGGDANPHRDFGWGFVRECFDFYSDVEIDIVGDRWWHPPHARRSSRIPRTLNQIFRARQIALKLWGVDVLSFNAKALSIVLLVPPRTLRVARLLLLIKVQFLRESSAGSTRLGLARNTCRACGIAIVASYSTAFKLELVVIALGASCLTRFVLEEAR